ncbi:hypothetical protein [Candidatus Nanohalococcus occultus]|uniref:Gingipain propeptide domain-containing protein n=1 Tax=Candidatus Nanohalococcus occultus TaxID=2978047 RepID=A0ABY8CFI3_9ARCH|nr:hypothetical protein SVXNc_0968 [Candidatus Nanohaloarchaeota archaeon SVXNc]
MRKTLAALILICMISPGISQEPDNITVELEFSPSNAYMEGQSYENTQVLTAPSFGYVSSSQPLGLVSYNEDPLRIGFIDSERYYITQKTGEFLIPFTRNGAGAIEDRRELIESGELLTRLNPSIGFPLGAERVIRVSYHFTYKVSEIVGPKTGIEEILVRNSIHAGNQTELTLRTS